MQLKTTLVPARAMPADFCFLGRFFPIFANLATIFFSQIGIHTYSFVKSLIPLIGIRLALLC